MSGEYERGRQTIETVVGLFKSDTYAQGLQYYIKCLVEVDEWARAQQPFQVGDRVVINGVHETIDKNSGWYHCRDELQDGTEGEVTRLDFYKPRGWSAMVNTGKSNWPLNMKYLTKVVPPEVCDCCGQEKNDV